MVAKNSGLLIVTTYDNLLLDVYFLCANGASDITGTRRAAFWIQAPGVFHMNRTFWGSFLGVSQYRCKVKAVNVR